MAAQTFNPDSADPGSLSGGNLTFTSSVSARGAYAPYSYTSGKHYFEAVFNLTNANAGFGLTNNATPDWFGLGTGGTNYLGGVTESIGFFPAFGSGAIYKNNSQVVSGIGTNSSSATYCFAVDIDNGNLWVRKDAGNWNNNGSADPASNTGGTPLPTGPLYVLASFTDDTQIATLNFGGSSFAQSVPSGFASGWLIPATIRNSEFWNPIYISTDAGAVGVYQLSKLTISTSCGLQTANIVFRSGSAGSGEKARVVVVADAAGVPSNASTPLFSSNTLTSISSGTNTFTFTSANLVAGTYWAGLAYSASSGGRNAWKSVERATTYYFNTLTDAASLPNYDAGWLSASDSLTIQFFTGPYVGGSRAQAFIMG